MPDAIAHITSIAGAPLCGPSGDRLGKVDDAVVRLGAGDALPVLVGLKARIAGREMFVPIARVAKLGPDVAVTNTTKLNLAQFERREGEVLLRADLLDHSVIDVNSARLVNAREVELVNEGGTWRVVGIDPSLRPRLWRLAPRRFRGHDSEHGQLIPWTDLEPFVGHVPSSRLKLTSRRLGRLHPAQIADLVEAASHDEGAEILAAVGDDPELEADVFEELDDEHQVEFLRGRSDEEVAEVMARMETDDAADLLLELRQERRLPILNELPTAKQVKIRSLLSHNPSTAGGLMNPDFVTMAPDATVEETLARLRGVNPDTQPISTVVLVDGAGRFAGTVGLEDLLAASAGATLDGLRAASSPSVTPEADLPEVALTMADYNLVGLPVIDGDGTPLGVIGVDDVLAVVVPEDWRRR
ncbi:magnesium transporter MgtE N-terminal domain-containing protein [Conexibacter sp. DBS9H8]|uniref:magnesium transporter MgtE N-terminal domain-containing protein n=1 Tax=Conexibacter sp. DBS9H8 TaxID=2937801 RepID=UPI00200CED30|nr:CBS domain-containing protein [Conexibacter sp. DBS9H8]